jgi:iron complex transport system ATP-binding protein
MRFKKTAILFNELSFNYGASLPFSMESFAIEIAEAAVTALLGPNGSGKTTILHLLVGLLKPKGGSIFFYGKPWDEYSSRDLKRLIGLVPQDEEIPFDLSLLEYVLLGRAPHLGLLELPGEKDRLIARSSIETTGLADLQHRSVPSMSGGERQMASIARALSQETEILLLDEPTSHLDIANTRRVLHLMRLLRERGKTVIFTTHDPNAAASISDHVILLREGRVLNAGPIRKVLTSKNLSTTYGTKVQVMEVMERLFVLVP